MNFQYLGYYLKWDPQECYYYASENTGFKANVEGLKVLTLNIVALMIKWIHFIITLL